MRQKVNNESMGKEVLGRARHEARVELAQIVQQIDPIQFVAFKRKTNIKKKCLKLFNEPLCRVVCSIMRERMKTPANVNLSRETSMSG